MAIKVPTDNLVIENARIIYRNFSGGPTPFDPVGGKRTFSVEIDREQAEALEEMGWKVKYGKPREDGEEPRIHLPVSVRYHPRVKPPTVKLINSRGQVSIDEEAIDMFDFMSFKKVDLILRPYYWKLTNGTEGVKNQLASIYVTIQEDELQLKYADIPEIEMSTPQRAIGAGGEPWGSPEDLGEIPDPESQYALEQGRGF